MSAINELIHKLEKELPEICEAKDLISHGIGSKGLFHRHLKDGEGPPFLRLGKATKRRKIRYLKQDVLNWLKDCYNEPSKKGNDNDSDNA